MTNEETARFLNTTNEAAKESLPLPLVLCRREEEIFMGECPYCTAEIPNGAVKCPQCGEDLSAAVEEPGWMEKAAQNVIKWLEDGVPDIQKWVDDRKAEGKTPRQIAEQAIGSARLWAGNVGFVAGMGDFLGPWGFGAGTLTDIGYAAKLSVQMGQRVYCAYGHNINDDLVKVRIVSAFGGGAAGAGKLAGAGAARVGKRLIEKYLRGALLQAVKAFLRRIGIVFIRKAFVAWLPIVGSGVNLFVNRALMKSLGKSILNDLDSPADSTEN